MDVPGSPTVDVLSREIAVNWNPPNGAYDYVQFTLTLISTDSDKYFIDNTVLRSECEIGTNYSYKGYSTDISQLFNISGLCPKSTYNATAQTFQFNISVADTGIIIPENKPSMLISAIYSTCIILSFFFNLSLILLK